MLSPTRSAAASLVILIASVTLAADGEPTQKQPPNRTAKSSPARKTQTSFDFVQPHIVLQNAKEIGVSTEKLSEIKDALRSLERDSADLRHKAKIARQQLADLFEEAVIDEAKSVEAFETMLAAERADKTLQLKTLIQLRNRLTLEQRLIATKLQAAKRLSSRPPVGSQTSPYASENLPVIRIAEPPRRMATKMQSIRQAQRQMQRDGGDTSRVRKLLRQASPLMKLGNESEAEALLDEAIELLDDKAKTPASNR